MENTGIKVLVLDDEEGITFYTSKLLESKGYTVCGVQTAQDAINKYKEFQPDISLLDVYLENSAMDGLQVLEEIKKIDPQSIAIMVSRVSDPASIDNAKALGAFNYLFKPLEFETMFNEVREAAKEVKRRR